MATNKPKNPDRELPDDFIEPDVIRRFRERFRTATHNQIDQYSKEAYEWFRAQVSRNFNPRARQIIDVQSSYKKLNAPTGQSFVGKLYLFKYEAEHAGDEETQTFDQFPMVFVFGSHRSEAGKLYLNALNLHYCSPKERQILFEELMKTSSNRTISQATKLKINWNIIKAVCKSALYSKAVHSYRVDRLESKFVEIPPLSWPIAVFLRLEKFVKIKTHEQNPLPSTMRRNINKRAAAHKKKMG